MVLNLELGSIVFERHLAMVHDVLSYDVALNYIFPPVNNSLGIGSAFDIPRSSLPKNIEFRDDWNFC